MSLEPIYDNVRKERPETYIFSIGFERGHANNAFSSILTATMPIIVSSSPGSAVDWMQILRPRWSYYFVGVEHGLSPFKKFTYSEAFLCYDEYFSPTLLWKERLERLYPASRTRFHLGGYPKAMQYNPGHLKKTDKPLRKKDNIVVIFSWGIKEDELYRLPDMENLTYLLHPSQEDFSRSSPFKKSKILKSTSEVTVNLLGQADIIFGDMSSLTFEISRSVITYYFLDRRIYIENYDVENEFLIVENSSYGTIPKTRIKIDRKFILDKFDLEKSISGKIPEDKKPLGMCPALNDILNESNSDLCTAGIIDIARRHDMISFRKNEIRPDAATAEFIRHAYVTVLGREPDIEGFRHYADRIRNSKDSLLVVGIDIFKDLASSEEAQKRTDIPNDVWPILQIKNDPT